MVALTLLRQGDATTARYDTARADLSEFRRGGSRHRRPAAYLVTCTWRASSSRQHCSSRPSLRRLATPAPDQAAAIGLAFSAAIFIAFTRGLDRSCPPECLRVDALSALGAGFAEAPAGANLLWRLASRWARSSACCRLGIGPALTTRCSSRATLRASTDGRRSSCSGGIYYGGDVGGSTTGDPAQHAR